MSDAAITTIVTGLVTIVGTFFGFLSLWIKVKYGVQKAEEAATKAKSVENKVDENTNLTKTATAAASVAAVSATSAAKKAEETNAEKLKLLQQIEKQTNGTATQQRIIVDRIDERVSKLEEYNHETAHRIMNALNAIALRLEKLVVLQEMKPSPSVIPSVASGDNPRTS